MKDSQLKLIREIKAPLKVLHQQLFHCTYFRITPEHRTVVPGHSPIPRVSDLEVARTFFQKIFSLLHIFPQRRDHIKRIPEVVSLNRRQILQGSRRSSVQVAK